MSDLKPHDLWQQEWSEPFVGNYEAFIDVHELYALFTDHKELQSQIDQLKTQLSGITQYGSVDAAELTRLRDENIVLIEAIKAIDRHVRESNHNTPAYRYFSNLCNEALAKHKQSDEKGG